MSPWAMLLVSSMAAVLAGCPSSATTTSQSGATLDGEGGTGSSGGHDHDHAAEPQERMEVPVRVLGRSPFPAESAGPLDATALQLGPHDYGVGTDAARSLTVFAGRLLASAPATSPQAGEPYLVLASVSSWSSRTTLSDLDIEALGEEAEWVARAHHVSTDLPLVFMARGGLRAVEPAMPGARPTLVVGVQVRISHQDDRCVTVAHVVDEDSGVAWATTSFTLAAGAELSIPHP